MGTIESSVDQTVSKLEDQLKLWGAKLDELLAKAEVASQEAKVDAHTHIDQLKADLEIARARLHEAKAAGDDKWHILKHGIERSWQELEVAFKKLTA